MVSGVFVLLSKLRVAKLRVANFSILILRSRHNEKNTQMLANASKLALPLSRTIKFSVRKRREGYSWWGRERNEGGQEMIYRCYSAIFWIETTNAQKLPQETTQKRNSNIFGDYCYNWCSTRNYLCLFYCAKGPDSIYCNLNTIQYTVRV